MAIKIYTDASSNLFKKILDDKGLDIVVLPMTLEIDDKKYICYKDDIDVEEMSKDFYLKMQEGLRPKTSLISPGLFMESCQEEIKKGNKVIYISLASGISGSFQSATLIKNQINEEYNDYIVEVIDSKTAGFGEGMIAIKAFNYVKEGLEFQDVVKKTNEYVYNVRSEFTVDNIQYLAQTGRVSKLASTIASVLSIKPLLYGSNEGKIEVTSKVRGRNMAINALADQVIKNIKDKNSLVYIAHCNSIDYANKLKDLLNKADINNIEIYYYDLVTGAHVGPGTIAVFYEGETREIEKKNFIQSYLHK